MKDLSSLQIFALYFIFNCLVIMISRDIFIVKMINDEFLFSWNIFIFNFFSIFFLCVILSSGSTFNILRWQDYYAYEIVVLSPNQIQVKELNAGEVIFCTTNFLFLNFPFKFKVIRALPILIFSLGEHIVHVYLNHSSNFSHQYKFIKETFQ